MGANSFLDTNLYLISLRAAEVSTWGLLGSVTVLAQGFRAIMIGPAGPRPAREATGRPHRDRQGRDCGRPLGLQVGSPPSLSGILSCRCRSRGQTRAAISESDRHGSPGSSYSVLLQAFRQRVAETEPHWRKS